jgi:glycosyltransferase involved in cell wall biosynthesis
MRACFISHTSSKGGAERCLLDIIDALGTVGVECFVVLPSPGPLAEELRSRGVGVEMGHYYGWWANTSSPLWKRLGRVAINLARVIPIVGAIRRSQSDVVCTNTMTVSVGAYAAKLLGIPHIWWIQEFGYEDHRLIFDMGRRISLGLIDRLSAICVAISQAVAKELRQSIPPEKLKVVYPWVSVQECGLVNPSIAFEAYRDADIRCVFVGQLKEEKRPGDAIKATAELVHRGQKPQLYIIGSGSAEYEAYLRSLIRRNAIEHNVTLLGHVENPFELILNMDCLLMCSPAEAFGRVTVEAMMAGKPVVGARGGATPELISDGFNGLLYSPGSHSELADRIDYLYKNPIAGRRMGQNGKRWAAEFLGKARYADEALRVLTDSFISKTSSSAWLAR